MSIPDVFERITAALDSAGIVHQVCGSFASTYHGTPRSTADINFIIEATPAQLQEFAASLPDDKYYVDVDAALEAHKHESMFNVIDITTSWKIDLIMLKSNAFAQEEFRRRQRATICSVPVFVLSAEDAILSKLEWSKIGGSHRQLEDVAGIVRIRWASLDGSYLKKWIEELGLETQWNEAHKLAGISEAL
jgi:hypothetical protein